MTHQIRAAHCSGQLPPCGSPKAEFNVGLLQRANSQPPIVTHPGIRADFKSDTIGVKAESFVLIGHIQEAVRKCDRHDHERIEVSRVRLLDSWSIAQSHGACTRARHVARHSWRDTRLGSLQ
jgi:hypothetical protein